MKAIFRNTLLVLLSGFLLALLASRTDLSLSAIARSFGQIPALALLLFAGLIATNLAFAALKWLLVLNALTPGRKPQLRFTEALLTTTMGALLGQFMPFQLGVALARSVGGKLGIGSTPRENFGTTFLEQAFDAVLLGATTGASIVGLTMHLTLLGWMVQTVIWGALVVLVSLKLPFALNSLARLASVAPLGARFSKFTSRMAVAVGQAAVLPRTTLSFLALLSGLRYAANVLAVLVLLAGLGMLRYAVPVAIAFPVIQVIAFVPVTPGNLGVVEWSWSAVLTSAGAAASPAALFAFAVRIMYISVVVLLLLPLLCLCLFQYGATNWGLVER